MGSRKRFWAYLLSLVLTCLLSAYANSQNAPAEFQRPEAVLQVGHRRAVRAIVFGPDGRWLASGAKDNTVKIWEVASGRLLRTLYGHGAAVNALAVSPDGKLLASGSGNTYDVRYAKLFFKGGQVGGAHEDTTVRLWEVASGRQLRTLQGHGLAVMALAFSADGRTLTSASSDFIKVWEVSSGNELRSLPVFRLPNGIGPATEIASLLFEVPHKNPDVHKWEKTFEELATEIVISPGGETVAAALPRKKFRLYDTIHIRQPHEIDLLARPEAPGSLAFSRNGQLLAYIKNSKEIVVQNVASEQDVWHMPINTSGQSVAICFAPDGKFVMTESLEGSRRILQRWSGSTDRPLEQVTINDDRISRLTTFSPDGRYLAMAARGGHSPELRDSATAELVRVFGNAETRRANAGQGDAMLRNQLVEFGLTKQGELSEAEEDVGDFSSTYRIGESVTFTLDGRWLLTKRGRIADLSTVVWDTSTGTEVQDFAAGQFTAVGNPEESPDGRFRIVPRYEAETKGAGNSLIPSFSSSKDQNPYLQRVKLIDAHSGRKSHTFDVGAVRDLGRIPAAGFSLDSSRIAVTGFKVSVVKRLPKVDPETFVFDTETGKKLAEFSSPENEERGPATALALSRDARILAAGYRNNSLELIDVASGKPFVSIPHLGGTTALSFSRDGRLLALLGKDGDTYLFDTNAGQLLATLVSAGNGDWLVVAPDGKFDGSPGGWNQILWRFAGDTFNVAPVETFFNEFYYPGLLAEILAGKKLRETRDFAELDRRQASLQIEMIGPSRAVVNNRTIQVQVRVAEAQADKDHAEGSGVRDVRLFRNGSLVNAWRGNVQLDSNGKALLETTIPIVAGPNRLTAYAFNHDNIKSPDASFVVTGSPALKRSGIAYVLSVGINQYSNGDYNLKFAVADAEDVYEQLKVQQRKVGTVGGVEVVPLLNSEATKENILLALKRLAGSDATVPAGAPEALNKLQPAQPEDEVFVYFAGHGAATGQRFYLIPYDLGYTGRRTELDQAGWESIVQHSISDLELEGALEKVDARDVLLVIDACNSGQALEAEERRRGPMNSKGLAQLAYEKGMYVLTAAQGYQAALEVKELGHGLLTFALVEEGLKTASADRSPKDGKVVAREWMDYATVRVPELQEAQIEAAQKQGRTITFAEGEEEVRGEMKNRGLQRPRVFYRREADPEPLVVAKP